MPTFGSLFSGVGGMDLGLERAGWQCAWQVECDEYATKILAKHWPAVRRHADVRTFLAGGEDLEPWRVDLLAGGFPCQDLSLAGKRAGLAGERSGLWSEFLRIIRLLRPGLVLVENVPGLLAPCRPGEPAALGRVLGELAASGYDAEWDCIPASAFGATHLRYRVFVVAYPNGECRRAGWQGRPIRDDERLPIQDATLRSHETKAVNANVDGERPSQRQGQRSNTAEELAATERVRGGVAIDADPERVQRQQGATQARYEGRKRRAQSEPDRCGSPFVGSGWWSSEPDVGRLVYGISRRLVEPAIRGLGNAVVPQVAQWLGERLINLFYEEL